jgi:hypothetical protein
MELELAKKLLAVMQTHAPMPENMIKQVEPWKHPHEGTTWALFTFGTPDLAKAMMLGASQLVDLPADQLKALRFETAALRDGGHLMVY